MLLSFNTIIYIFYAVYAAFYLILKLHAKLRTYRLQPYNA